MKETYWGYWLVLLGVFIIGVMLLVNNLSTTNTQDYYNIKEVTQASMIDAMDFSYYRLYGNIKISEQKFVENFIRRFSENINLANTYDVGFYDLYEVPPKVSVKIATGTRDFNIANTQNDYDVVTTISAILELGVNGEGTPSADSGPKKLKCLIDIRPELMNYFAGETVSGHSLAKEYNTFNDKDLSESYPDVTPGMKMGDFKKWFENKFGSKTSNTKYKDLPDYIKEFERRRWIEIEHS